MRCWIEFLKKSNVTIAIYAEFATILNFPMKISLLTPALVAILGLALAGVPITAQAQTSTNSAPATAAAASTPAKVTKATKIRYTGSITAIDATSVTVANSTKSLTLAITPTTTFKKDGVVATVADFAVGDKVTGSYSTDATGALTANSLHKKTPKTPPATTAPAAAPAAAPATPAAQ
jgi:hypothetical protein